MRDRLIPIALALSIAVAAVAPVRNYDLFWHLATGRWIAEHRAVPHVDPFGVASDRHPWVNGEWLFQLAIYAIHRIGGVEGLSVARGLFAALLFTVVFLIARRSARAPSGESNAADPAVALLLTAVAFAGASPVLDVRPASAAMLFVVLALVARSPLSQLLLAMVWINVHPSALLAPMIAASTTRRIAAVAASLAGLLANPYGIRALIAPLELMAWVRSGEFINAEWLPSPPMVFPLLYICVAVGVVAIALSWSRDGGAGSRLERFSHAALFILFGYLAVRHVRNQGLFFAVFPILIAPLVPTVAVRRRIVYASAAGAIALVALFGDHRLGVTAERFPIDATERLRATGLTGNIYNPDQFGGFLIWSFYPERRVLTDGRNELYRTFIPEYASARNDERLWRALLEKYEIDLAVDEYAGAIPVRNASTGETLLMPASLAFWPRERWALIGFDAAGMIFARRAAFPDEILARWEIHGIVPDDPSIRRVRPN